MNKIKKITSVITCICLAAVCVIFTSCSSADNSNSNNNEGKLKIVCTVFPQYDWVKRIMGNELENADVTLLLDNGVDLHNYQPTADDIITISNCDMFIYTGGESDKWTEDVLASAKNEHLIAVNLMTVLGDAVKEEETVEGMESEEHGEEDEDEAEYDEHIWLSLKNAKAVCTYIADRLAEIDEDNSDIYTSNANAYIDELNKLDSEYQAAVDSAVHKTLIFGDRFPFRYLTDDYNLEYYAAFAGCSAETEASFETVSFLANKADELGVNAILTIEGANHQIAETIVKSTKEKNQKILFLDSLQSTTSSDIEAGKTYLSAMQSNLEVLKEAMA